SVNASTSGVGPSGDAEGLAFLGGQTAADCSAVADSTSAILSHGAECAFLQVTVPLNTPLPATLLLSVHAGSNAGFGITPQFAEADAAHTFELPIGVDILDLPPGFTFNAPDWFIVNNRFLPPDETAVPEPATALMLLIGLAGLGALRCRQRLARAIS